MMYKKYSFLTSLLAIAVGAAGFTAIAGRSVQAQEATPVPGQAPMLDSSPSQSPIPNPSPSVDQTPMPMEPTSQPGQQPGMTQTAPDDLLSNSENLSPTQLLQQMSATGSFTTLARAVEAADLDNTLASRGGNYTIFAPTDEAFAALPPTALEQLLQPENQELLRRLLAYHVVPNEVASDQLNTGGVETLGGGIAVRVTPERVIINDGSVVQPDIQTANGVVHVVNRVLMPAELRQQLTNLQ